MRRPSAWARAPASFRRRSTIRNSGRGSSRPIQSGGRQRRASGEESTRSSSKPAAQAEAKRPCGRRPRRSAAAAGAPQTTGRCRVLTARGFSSRTQRTGTSRSVPKSSTEPSRRPRLAAAASGSVRRRRPRHAAHPRRRAVEGDRHRRRPGPRPRPPRAPPAPRHPRLRRAAGAARVAAARAVPCEAASLAAAVRTRPGTFGEVVPPASCRGSPNSLAWIGPRHPERWTN